MSPDSFRTFGRQGRQNTALSNIYISYAPGEQDFARKLVEAYAKKGQAVWLDPRGQSPDGGREQEIFARIETATYFLCVLSPEYLASDICRKELAHATGHRKHLIKIVYDEVRDAELPKELTAADTVNFRQGDNFNQAFRSLNLLFAASLRLDSFISYSRRDQEFVDRLHDELVKRGKRVWIDRKDIQPSERWKEAIFSGIVAADSFVFVISPDSAASTNCKSEIGYAIENHKRLIPVAHRPTRAELLPKELNDCNYLPFPADGDFEHNVDALVQVIETAPENVRAHTRWLTRATEWEKSGRRRSLLARGKDLRDAEAWLREAEQGKGPSPTGSQREYVNSSRTATTARHVSAVIVIAVLAAAAAFTARYALDQQRQAESRQLAAEAAALVDVDPARAMRLAIQSSNLKPNAPAEKVLRQALLKPYLNAELSGHKERVTAAAFSPDARLLATGSQDHEARIWDAETGQTVKVLSGHRGPVFGVAFSHDGKKLVTASTDHSVRLWDTQTWEGVEWPAHDQEVWEAAFSPDDRYIVTASNDRTARVWEVASGRQMTVRQHVAEVTSAAFSPDSRWVVSTSGHFGGGGPDAAQVSVWEASTGRAVANLRGHTSKVLDARFSPDGKWVVTSSADGSARLWDVSNWQPVPQSQWRHDWVVTHSIFSPDSRLVVTVPMGSNHTPVVRDVQSGQTVAELKGHLERVWDAAFSEDGRHVVTASEDGTARVWNVGRGEAVAEIKAGLGRLYRVVLSRDGRRLSLVGDASTAGVWSPFPARDLIRPAKQLEPARKIFYSGDGRYVLSADDSHVVKVWKTDTFQNPVALVGHRDSILIGTVSPDGKWAVTSSLDSTVRVWDANTGQHRAELPGDIGIVRYIVFSPDGRRMVTSGNSSDYASVLWDTATWETVSRLKGHRFEANAIAFSPDGKWLVTGSGSVFGAVDKVARVWDPSTGELLKELSEHGERVTDAAFSPDSRLLITTSIDDKARVWEAGTWRLVKTLEEGTEGMYSVAFSPDGAWAVTRDGLGTNRVWQTATWARSAVIKSAGRMTVANSAVSFVGFSQNGKCLVTSGSNGLTNIWSTDTWSSLMEIPDGLRVMRGVPFVQGGTRVVFTDNEGVMTLYACEICGSAEELLKLASAHLDSP